MHGGATCRRAAELAVDAGGIGVAAFGGVVWGLRVCVCGWGVVCFVFSRRAEHGVEGGGIRVAAFGGVVVWVCGGVGVWWYVGVIFLLAWRRRNWHCCTWRCGVGAEGEGGSVGICGGVCVGLGFLVFGGVWGCFCRVTR